MKYVCETKVLTANKIKNKIVDVNTMLLDTIGLFNCFTRVTHNDFDAYLGGKVIFNQMVFLQISNANCELRELIRHYLSLRLFKKKQKRLINKKEIEDKMGKGYIKENIDTIKIPFKGIIAFNKSMKASRNKKYIGRVLKENQINEEEAKDVPIERFLTYNKRYVPNKENVNTVNTLKPKREITSYNTKKTKPNLQLYNTIVNNKQSGIDLLGLSLNEKSHPFKEERIDTGNYPKFETVKTEENKMDILLDMDTIANINKNVTLVNSINTAIENSNLSNSFNMNLSKSPVPNPILYNTVNPTKTNQFDLSSIDFTKKYDNKITLPNSFNSTTVNSQYPDLSNHIPNNKPHINESRFKTTSTPIPIPNPVNSNINLSSYNTLSMSVNPSRNQNNLYQGYTNYQLNQYNSNISMSINLNNTQRLPISVNSLSSINRSYNNNSKFSQEDMSFLSGTSQTNKKEQSEDYLSINRNTPEVFSELKEKIFFYYSLNKQIKKIDSKGYIGIAMKQGFKINKKTFFLNMLQPSWKDENSFNQKDFDKNIMYKVTETNYHIDIINKSTAVKLLTYSISPNLLSNQNILFTSFNWYQNTLALSFKYNSTIIKSHNVYKMTISLVFNQGYQCGNILSSGTISRVKPDEYLIAYGSIVNESKVQFGNIMQGMVRKVIVRIEMKNGIVSNNEIRVSYSNSVSSQENLTVSKMALLSFEYDMV